VKNHHNFERDEWEDKARKYYYNKQEKRDMGYWRHEQLDICGKSDHHFLDLG